MPFKEKFNIVADYLPKPSRRRPGNLINVKFLVVHDTGNPNSTAQGNVNFYRDTAHTVPIAEIASAHIFLDDKQIVECIPALTAPPEKALHVLKKVEKDNELFGINANDGAIGVEYCYGTRIDADKAYEKYLWVLAKLCFEFKLDPSKDIVGHFFLDPNRKTDPVTGLAHSRRSYDRLLRDVVIEYNDCTGTAIINSLVLTASNGTATTTVKLNVRKQPNTRAIIEEVIPANTLVSFTGVVENGETVNNNPKWLVNANGNFFWSGGVKIL